MRPFVLLIGLSVALAVRAGAQLPYTEAGEPRAVVDELMRSALETDTPRPRRDVTSSPAPRSGVPNRAPAALGAIVLLVVAVRLVWMGRGAVVVSTPLPPEPLRRAEPAPPDVPEPPEPEEPAPLTVPDAVPRANPIVRKSVDIVIPSCAGRRSDE